MLFDDTANPRVQSHAAASLVNWLVRFETKLLAPFLDVIMEKLMVTLRASWRYLQEQSLTTIASVATCAQALFIKVIFWIFLTASGTQVCKYANHHDYSTTIGSYQL